MQALAAGAAVENAADPAGAQTVVLGFCPGAKPPKRWSLEMIFEMIF